MVHEQTVLITSYSRFSGPITVSRILVSRRILYARLRIGIVSEVPICVPMLVYEQTRMACYLATLNWLYKEVISFPYNIK